MNVGTDLTSTSKIAPEAAGAPRQAYFVLVDRREQRPLNLPNAEPATLTTGDYSIRTPDRDYRDRIAVERKSLEDLYGCFGQSRERFSRELQRLAAYPYPAIVVEATWSDVINGTRFSRIHPHSAIGSLIAWETKYRIPVWLVGDRRAAATTVQKILEFAVKYIESVEQQQMRARNPEKKKARSAVSNAFRDGRLERKGCEICGTTAQAHHEDYSRALDVRWFCFKHHREEGHGQVVMDHSILSMAHANEAFLAQQKSFPF
jgi:ERCC4-type nuclease